MTRTEAEVVVIGAGIAGLAAARVIAEAGRHVMVVEARDRVGGRIFTANPGAEAVELGAEFVHGKPPELWNLLQEADFRTVELNGSQFCWSEGRLSDCGRLLDQDFKWIEALKHWRGDDCSLADYLDHVSVSEATRLRLTDYVEGFNAADHREIGVMSLGKQQTAEDAIEGDRIFRVVGGYCQVPEFVAMALIRAGGEVMLNARVISVDWKSGAVRAEVHRGHQISQIYASKAIVTLPLGVLQTGGVDFRPRPEKIFEAAARSRMGSVQRTVLQFHEPFWMNSGDAIAAQLHKLQFLYSNGNAPSVWWTSFPEDHSWLTAWTGGPRTNLLPESQTEVERHLISELAHIFGRDASVIHKLLIGSFAHNWQRDRFSLGAYSFAGVNSGKASEMMAEPVNETLYFAGEHTDVSGHLGTVHGALRSGFRTASQVLGL